MEKKSNYIEMMEKTDNHIIHMTKQENRKIKSKEFKNINFILNNHTNVAKYTWEEDGKRVFL